MQPAQQRISEALARLGERSLLDWARKHVTVPLPELNAILGAGLVPVDLESSMADSARNDGRYDEFVRTEAVRNLNREFPRGFGSSGDQKFGIASGWAMWAGLFEPSQEEAAKVVWDRLIAAMREYPEWCPTDPDDRSVLEAFAGFSFEPSEGAKRLAGAIGRLDEYRMLDNQPYSEEQAIANLRRRPAGYLWLYGLYSLDGQVGNGGFDQFYDNTGGTPACAAIEGFRALEREDFAALVAELLLYAQLLPELARTLPDCGDLPPSQAPPRRFEQLDTAYYELTSAETHNWLEVSIIELILKRPEAF